MDTGDAACAAALAALGLSPARLRRVLHGRTPAGAWNDLVTGVHPEDPEGRVRALVHDGLPDVMWARCSRAGIAVQVLGEAGYPDALASDPEAPAVLFSWGQLGPGPADNGERRIPGVAVVGTRSATAGGRQLAVEIGRHLSTARVTVVSGLAEGIDSAALAGALDGATAPVAVLGTAHDRVGTFEQRRLARAIGGRGAVVSELPPGTDSARWRFAVRNRVMAALADVVVVVECHGAGGALHTVRAAAKRGLPVAALPGSPLSPASDGTNALLVDGASCVRGGADVVRLLADRLGWEPSPQATATASATQGDGAGLDASATAVLDALDDRPSGLDQLVLRSGFSIPAVSLALEQLAELGLAAGQGGWWSRTGRRLSKDVSPRR